MFQVSWPDDSLVELCQMYLDHPARRKEITAASHQLEKALESAANSIGKVVSPEGLYKFRHEPLQVIYTIEGNLVEIQTIRWMPQLPFMYADIAGMIDHSLLQQTLTDAELDQGCALAKEYRVASVCIKPYYVARAAQLLAGSGVAVGTTIGFPHGGHVTALKVAEAERAVQDGARELDMVVNIGKVLSRDWPYVADDIRPVVDFAHRHKALVKVIFENCFLQDEHKEQLCKICGEVRADFVKTSTGYGATGATDEDLRLMRRCSPPHVQVKAAGGVRTFDRLLAVRDIGVTRVGATATKAILDECRSRL